MQTLDFKDDTGNLPFMASAKYPGTFPAPTSQLAYEWFKKAIIDEVSKHKDEPKTPALIHAMKEAIGNWHNYKVESLEFNIYGDLVNFILVQSIR